MATKQLSPLYAVPSVECAMCKALGAKFVCGTCGTFYCNVPCQIKHWPTHKDVCIPRLVMATPLMGTAVSLDQHITPVMPILPNTSNEKMNAPSMKPNAHSVPPTPPTVPPRNEVVKNHMPHNSPNVGKCFVKQTVVANGATMEKLPTNEEKTKQLKAEPVSKNANGTTVKSSTIISEQKVEKNSPKAVFPAVGKPPSSNEKPKQQKEEPVCKNVNNTNTKMSTEAARKTTTAKYDPMPECATNAKLLQQGPFPEPGSMVKISYVADDKIYIYETGPGLNGERNGVELLVSRSLECAKSVKSHLSAPPAVDDIVFAGYDGDYYRAVVKSVKKDTVEVFYPDFGNSETVQWNTLKEIPDPKIKYANCLTHGVWIESIATFTPPIKKFLSLLENVATFMLITVIDVQNAAGVKMVEMYHCSEKYHLSLKLQDFQTASAATADAKKQQLPPQPKSPEKTPKIVVTNPNAYTPVSMQEFIDSDSLEGKGLELVIVNTSTVFTDNQLGVMTKSNYALYKAMLQECEKYGKIDKNPYEPKENELCLVNKQGFWYRTATIASPMEDKRLLLFLVDEGIFIENEDIQIRRYPPGLTRHQFAVECVLENTNILLEAIGGNEENADSLCGKLIKTDVHISKDEETYETSHITILSIC